MKCDAFPVKGTEEDEDDQGMKMECLPNTELQDESPRVQSDDNTVEVVVTTTDIDNTISG